MALHDRMALQDRAPVPHGARVDDEIEAGRQFETMKHLARTERRRIRLVVDFHSDGRITSNAYAPLTEVALAERAARSLSGKGKG